MENPKEYYFLVSLFNQTYWVVGSIIGSILGNIIPFNVEGIDFVLTALFVTIFVEQWLTTKEHRPAVIGVLASVLCLMILGGDNFLIPTMVIIILLLMIQKGKLEFKE